MSTANDVIEIDEPLDLEEIAALARKIEQGTPQR